ncbi:MAG: hypothetical protein ACYC6T_08120 [Thermoleophilia bacterium]
MATCKSCGVEILWVVTKSGKRMPLDAEPHPAGNIVIDDVLPPHTPTAHVLDGHALGLAWAAKVPVRFSHFATCPEAAQHRRRS